MTDPILIILAGPRSFSSVVSAMLGQHPQMYGLMELNLFAADTVANMLRGYRMAGDQARHGLLRVLAQLHHGEQTPETIDAAQQWLMKQRNQTTKAIMDHIIDMVSPKIAVEKSPRITFRPDHLARAAEMYPGAFFLHLTRHPRTMCQSQIKITSRNQQWGGKLDSKQIKPQNWWMATQNNILQFSETLAEGQYMRIKGGGGDLRPAPLSAADRRVDRRAHRRRRGRGDAASGGLPVRVPRPGERSVRQRPELPRKARVPTGPGVRGKPGRVARMGSGRHVLGAAAQDGERTRLSLTVIQQGNQMAARNQQTPAAEVEFDVLNATRVEAVQAHRGELLLAVTGTTSGAAVLASDAVGGDAWVNALALTEEEEEDTHARVTLSPGALDLLAPADDDAALYVATTSLAGGRIMRRAEDKPFEPVFEASEDGSRILGLHSLSVLDKRMFAAPVVAAYSAWPEDNCIYVSSDPTSGRWEAAGPPGFGDENNLGISALTVWRGSVWAGTFNPERGFQLWRTDARGKAPYSWEMVISAGARRYTLNPGIAAMYGFGNALYIATGIPGPGYDLHHDVGPGAAELLRVYEDGKWDIIAGSPRFSPDGLKVPLSAMSTGFHNPYNNVISDLVSHRNRLYAATFNCATMLDVDVALEHALPQLWASDDGEDWEPVPIGDGAALEGMLGISCLASTSGGLVLGGTAKSFHFVSPLHQDEEEVERGVIDDGPQASAVVIHLPDVVLESSR
jgi:hypothetical protein